MNAEKLKFSKSAISITSIGLATIIVETICLFLGCLSLAWTTGVNCLFALAWFAHLGISLYFGEPYQGQRAKLAFICFCLYEAFVSAMNKIQADISSCSEVWQTSIFLPSAYC